jgi:hypothetical protein
MSRIRINFDIEREIKEKFEAVVKNDGTNVANALSLFIKRCINVGTIGVIYTDTLKNKITRYSFGDYLIGIAKPLCFCYKEYKSEFNEKKYLIAVTNQLNSITFHYQPLDKMNMLKKLVDNNCATTINLLKNNIAPQLAINFFNEEYDRIYEKKIKVKAKILEILNL